MIATKYLELETLSCEVLDITDEVQGALQGTTMQAGVITVFVPGATGAVTTIEFEDGTKIEAAHIIRELNTAMQWLSYPDRKNRSLPVDQIKFTE